uniref:Uncharacterized protein n=1 Tax=Nelumbo nucifera TaxID=4432 RepID=A0A822Z528_NELNU|nr:TPA_asm: hypothetical protein HUJ06_014505 [Nelumbo nucifera]
MKATAQHQNLQGRVLYQNPYIKEQKEKTKDKGEE